MTEVHTHSSIKTRQTIKRLTLFLISMTDCDVSVEIYLVFGNGPSSKQSIVSAGPNLAVYRGPNVSSSHGLSI